MLFDATTFADRPARTLLPVGDYRMTVTEAAMKPDKNGNQMLAIKLSVLDGEHQGRLLWKYFNLNHPNPQTREIAESEVKEFCVATGVLKPADAQVFVGKTALVSVIIKRRKDTGEDNNEIRSFATDNGPGVSAAPTATAGKPAWMAKAS